MKFRSYAVFSFLILFSFSLSESFAGTKVKRCLDCFNKKEKVDGYEQVPTTDTDLELGGTQRRRKSDTEPTDFVGQALAMPTSVPEVGSNTVFPALQNEFSLAAAAIRTPNSCNTGLDFVHAIQGYWGMQQLFMGDPANPSVVFHKSLLKLPHSKISEMRTQARNVYENGQSVIMSWPGSFGDTDGAKKTTQYATYMVSRLILEMHDGLVNKTSSNGELLALELLVDGTFSQGYEGDYLKSIQDQYTKYIGRNRTYVLGHTSATTAAGLSPLFLDRLSSNERYSETAQRENLPAFRSIPYYAFLAKRETQKFLSNYQLKTCAELKTFCTQLAQATAMTVTSVDSSRKTENQKNSCR